MNQADVPQIITWSAAAAADARAQLQYHIYGVVPDLRSLALLGIERVRNAQPTIKAERWRFNLPGLNENFTMTALLVKPSEAPVRTILYAQCYRPFQAGLEIWESALRGAKNQRSTRQVLREVILGANIHLPPFGDIVSRGVGLLLFYPTEIVPDRKQTARQVINALSYEYSPDERGGVLAHWAALTSALRARISERFPKAAHVAWGHSRHGKAALLAAAFDPHFDAVIAHQAGRFGAALTRGARGESVKQIARTFPHWFCDRFIRERAAHCAVDQHHLLALIAPRPLLLGGARYDFWADHTGAVRAAQCAVSAFGRRDAAVSVHPDLNGGIVTFERRGWHGVNAEDWRCFLDFIDIKSGSFTSPSMLRPRVNVEANG